MDRFFGDCDLIVDCLDRPETQHVMNRCCDARGIPLIYAGVMSFIVVSAAGELRTMGAGLAIRCLLGMEEDNKGQIISVDLTTMEMMSIDIPKNPDCPVCGE